MARQYAIGGALGAGFVIDAEDRDFSLREAYVAATAVVSALLANDISSASNVTQPAVQQVHGILANDVASPSSVTNPAAGGVLAITAGNVLGLHPITTGFRVGLQPIRMGVYEGEAAVSYDAASEAIFAAFTTPPDATRKGLIDDVVVALKAAGIWTKLDALYVYAAADSQAALINWKAPGTYNGTNINSCAFAADLGFTGGSGKVLDTSFNPSTASSPNYTQNSASAFGFSNTNVSVTGGLVGNHSLTSLALYPRLSDIYYSRLNQSTTNVTVANTDSTGFYSASRSSSTLTTGYKNGASIGTDATASAAIFNTSISFMRADNTSYWTGQCCAGGFGQSLNSTEHAALYDAVRAYLTGVGVP